MENNIPSKEQINTKPKTNKMLTHEINPEPDPTTQKTCDKRQRITWVSG